MKLRSTNKYLVIIETKMEIIEHLKCMIIKKEN